MAKFTDGSGISRLWDRIQTLVTNMMPDVSNKMNIDGSNADDVVTFDGSLAVGENTGNVYTYLGKEKIVIPLPEDETNPSSASEYNDIIVVICYGVVYLFYTNSPYHVYKWTIDLSTEWERFPINSTPMATFGQYLKNSLVTVYRGRIIFLGGSRNGLSFIEFNPNVEHTPYRDLSAAEPALNVPPASFNADDDYIVSLGNYMHAIKGKGKVHFYFNEMSSGEHWYQQSSTPANLCYGVSVGYNNKIHIIGGIDYPNDKPYKTAKIHYSCAAAGNSSWKRESLLPSDIVSVPPSVSNDDVAIGFLLDDDMFILDNHTNSLYHWLGNYWRKEPFNELETLPIYSSKNIADDYLDRHSFYIAKDTTTSEVCIVGISYSDDVISETSKNSINVGSNTESHAQNSVAVGNNISATNSDQINFGKLNNKTNRKNVQYSMFTANKKNQSPCKKNVLNVQEDLGNDPMHIDNSSADPDYPSSEIFSLDELGNLFLNGAIYKARGQLNGVTLGTTASAVNNPSSITGREIKMEPGAMYLLFITGRIMSSGAFRGMHAYVIDNTWNTSGTGATTSALAIPHIATIGATGTAACRLTAISRGDATDGYTGSLGIGTCTTAIAIRYTLVKVSGSTDDFPAS